MRSRRIAHAGWSPYDAGKCRGVNRGEDRLMRPRESWLFLQRTDLCLFRAEYSRELNKLNVIELV
jgi:hypothetical protein